jgi:DNA primase
MSTEQEEPPREAREVTLPRISYMPRYALCCPFHAEETPSCVLGIGNRDEPDCTAWYCFGCTSGGTASVISETDDGSPIWRMELT